MFPTVGNGFLNIVLICDGFFHLCCQFRQRYGGQLDIEAFQQLPLVTHRRPEVKGTGTDLQDANISEGLYDSANRQKILHAPLKYRVTQPAVGQVGKRNLEPPQDFAGGKQAALRIPQAGAVRLRPLIQRSPKQNRYA